MVPVCGQRLAQIFQRIALRALYDFGGKQWKKLKSAKLVLERIEPTHVGFSLEDHHMELLSKANLSHASLEQNVNEQMPVAVALSTA